MSQKNDWIKLTVKFNGKCSSCGKDIRAGEGGLWSKKEKAIRHILCAAEQKRGSRDKSTLDLVCAICGGSTSCSECSLEPDCDRINVSPECICHVCLELDDPYTAYQEAFIARLRKVPKVKI